MHATCLPRASGGAATARSQKQHAAPCSPSSRACHGIQQQSGLVSRIVSICCTSTSLRVERREIFLRVFPHPAGEPNEQRGIDRPAVFGSAQSCLVDAELSGVLSEAKVIGFPARPKVFAECLPRDPCSACWSIIRRHFPPHQAKDFCLRMWRRKPFDGRTLTPSSTAVAVSTWAT